MHASWEVFPSSKEGRVGGLFVAIEVSIRDDYGEDGCVPCGGKALLSWWFSVEVVLSLVIYVGLISSGWL